MKLTPKMEMKPIKTPLGRNISGQDMGEGLIGVANYVRSDVSAAAVDGLLAGLASARDQMVEYAQPNAPWTDRTGDARRELHGDVINDGQFYGITLRHGESIDYGKWLEIRWGGRYAIIMPTQLLFAPKLGAIVAGKVKLALSGRGSKFRDVKTGRFT